MVEKRTVLILRKDGIKQRYHVRFIGNTYVNSRMQIYKPLAIDPTGLPILKTTNKKAQKVTITVLSKNNRKLKRKAFKLDGKLFDAKGYEYTFSGTILGTKIFKKSKETTEPPKQKPEKELWVNFHWVSDGKKSSDYASMKFTSRSTSKTQQEDEAQKKLKSAGLYGIEIDSVSLEPNTNVKYKYDEKLKRLK